MKVFFPNQWIFRNVSPCLCIFKHIMITEFFHCFTFWWIHCYELHWRFIIAYLKSSSPNHKNNTNSNRCRDKLHLQFSSQAPTKCLDEEYSKKSIHFKLQSNVVSYPHPLNIYWNSPFDATGKRAHFICKCCLYLSRFLVETKLYYSIADAGFWVHSSVNLFIWIGPELHLPAQLYKCKHPFVDKHTTFNV